MCFNYFLYDLTWCVQSLKRLGRSCGHVFLAVSKCALSVQSALQLLPSSTYTAHLDTSIYSKILSLYR
jgi:hypothetical protein